MNLRAFYYGIVDYITVIYYNYIVCNQKNGAKTQVCKCLTKELYEDNGRIETTEYNPSAARADNGL